MRRTVPLVISEAEEEGLRRLMAEGDKGEYRWSLAIILRARGASSHDIAGMLGVSRRSVDRWIEAYRVRGVEGLRCKPSRQA